MATKHRIPSQTRNVVVAGVIAAVLVVAGSALAFANGAFATPGADRVGTFAAIQAQLTPTTKAGPGTSGSSVRPSVPTTASPASGTEPEPTLGSTNQGDHTSAPVTATVAPNRDSTPEPTDAPEVEPARTTPVSYVVSSTLPRAHKDDHEPPEIPEKDD